MDKELLIRVLGTNNRVVIPSFGAFLRKQQGDALVFSPFLKGDDGFLAGIVSEEYGISDDDARAMVSAFAEHIASVLRARSKYYVDGVGTLVLDDNGSVTFVMDTTRQIPPSQPAAAPAQPEVVAQTPPVQPSIPTPQPQPINSRPVAPQPISAARPVYTPPSPPQPQPVPTPIRPVAQARPATSGGGFARPQQPSVAPIAQPQAAPQPMQQPTAAPMQGQPQQAPQHQQQSQQMQGTPMSTGQRPVGGERPMNRSAVGAGANGRRRPAARKKGKNDVWLVVAIVAALVVIILMVIGILTANEINNLQL